MRMYKVVVLCMRIKWNIEPLKNVPGFRQINVNKN